MKQMAENIFKQWVTNQGYRLRGDDISLNQIKQTNNYLIKINSLDFGSCHYIEKINRFIGLKVFKRAIQTPTLQNFFIARKLEKREKTLKR